MGTTKEADFDRISVFTGSGLDIFIPIMYNLEIIVYVSEMKNATMVIREMATVVHIIVKWRIHLVVEVE